MNCKLCSDCVWVEAYDVYAHIESRHTGRLEDQWRCKDGGCIYRTTNLAEMLAHSAQLDHKADHIVQTEYKSRPILEVFRAMQAVEVNLHPNVDSSLNEPVWKPSESRIVASFSVPFGEEPQRPKEEASEAEEDEECFQNSTQNQTPSENSSQALAAEIAAVPQKSTAVDAISGKKRRRSLTFEQKLAFVRIYKQVGSMSKVSRDYGIERSCLKHWVRKEDELLSRIHSGSRLRKKLKRSVELDEEIRQWFKSNKNSKDGVPRSELTSAIDKIQEQLGSQLQSARLAAQWAKENGVTLSDGRFGEQRIDQTSIDAFLPTPND